MREKGFKPSVVVLIAAMDESLGIGPTIEDLHRHVEKPWVLVVDGDSRDRTVDIAKNLDADVIRQEGLGKGKAIAQALEHVNMDIDYVVFTDADFTYPAEYIPQMIEVLEANPEVGMVCGNRFNSHFHIEEMPNMFYTGNRILALTHNLFNGVDLRDPLTGLRVVRWEILKRWIPASKGFDIEVELNHFVERQGFQITELPIHYRRRLGQKKLGMKHGFSIIKRILVESLRDRTSRV